MQSSRVVFPRILLVPALAVLPTIASAQQQVPARITQAIDESKLTVLKGNTHPLALPQYDRGPAPLSLPLNRMLLVLQRSPDQEVVLETLLEQQQEKSSPNYHQWLTPEQFGQQFGPADGDIQTVTSWLESHGFQVNHVAKGRGIIEFSGNAGQLQQAFHTAIHKYNVQGQDHWANATDPQIPTALSPVVAGIESLNNFPRHSMKELVGTFSRDKVTGKVTPIKPAFTFPSQNIELYALGPYDFATIYNVTPLWTSGVNGTGQRIGIVAETDINAQDFSDFHTIFGQTSPAPVLNVVHDGPDPGILADEPESDIDTQWSSAVAPGATIDFVVDEPTETTAGVDLSAEYIVDNNLDPVMSESYGLCELGLGSAGNAFFNQLWQQAAAQGITVFVASGDGGAAVCDQDQHYAQNGLSISGFASTPYNVSVGGTDFNDLNNYSPYWSPTNNSSGASALGYIPEMTWNDSCTNSEILSVFRATTAEQVCNNANAISDGLLVVVGGSGGMSTCTTPAGQTAGSCSGGYSKPAWQKGSPRDGKRDVPDVSLFASNGFNGSFYIVCENDAVSFASCSLNSPYIGYTFQGYGGTSVASPAFAGIMALINQKYGRQGNANYVLYGLASQAGVFHDVPTGSTIAMPCLSGSLNCTVSSSGDQYGVLSGYATGTGYDLATGLGSVNVANLVNAWPSANFIGTTTTLTIPSTAITHGASVSFSGNVSPKSGTTAPTGLVALIACVSGTAATNCSDTGVAQTGEVNVGSFTLSNGTCSGSPCATFSGSTNLLPGGTNYNLIAHYPGDSTFGASDSSPAHMSVNPENSQTNVAIVTFDPLTGRIANPNATSFAYGSPYILRADVTNSSGVGCFNSSSRTLTYGCPTGSLNITDNGAALGPGTFPLNSEGFTEYQAIQLPGGSHTLAASYKGDNSYNSSSTTDPITVTPASTSTQITATQSQTVIIGSSFWIDTQTTSNSSGVAPTGTYKFFDGTTQLTANGNVNGSGGSTTGTATLNGFFTTALSAPAGPHTLTAQYAGDSNYSSSTSTAVTVNAVYPDTMTLNANPTNVVYGQNTTVTLTAILDTTNPASNAALKPTGGITFTVSGTTTTTATQDSSGNWMLQSTLTFSPQQSTTVSVNYVGDSNYTSANQSVFVTVTIPDFSLSTNAGTLTITASQTGNGTMTITPTTSYASTVALTCESTTIAGLTTIIPGSTCGFAHSSVALGNSTAATMGFSLAIAGPSSTTTATGAPIRMRVPPDDPNGRNVWRIIGVFAGLGALFLFCSMPHRRLRAVLALSSVCALSFAIGCGGGGGGGGQKGPIATTTNMSASMTKVAPGATLNLTATVTGSSPTGMVNFNTTTAYCNSVNASLIAGTAQAQVTDPPGTCAYTAQYSGDASNLSSQSGSLNIVFTGNTNLTIYGTTSSDTHELVVPVTIQ